MNTKRVLHTHFTLVNQIRQIFKKSGEKNADLNVEKEK